MNSSIQTIAHPYGELIATYSNRFDSDLSMENEACPHCDCRSLIAFRIGNYIEVNCQNCEKFARASTVARALVELELAV